MEENPIAQTFPLPRDIKRPFVDWLSFSVPYDKGNFAWIVETLGERTDLDKGFMGYSQSFVTDFGARVGYSPDKPENKIHVVLSGKSLAGLNGQLSIETLIESVIEIEGKFCRIDIALDDFDGLLDFETIWTKLENKEVGTRFKTYSRIQGKKTKIDNPDDFSRIESGSLWKDTSRPMKSGDTIYIGNRSSDVFCRIYDKIKETKSNRISVNGKTYVLPFWNRLEFELKGTAADQYCNPHDFINLETGEICHKSIGKKVRRSSFLDRSFPRTAYYYLKFLEPTYKFKKLENGTRFRELKHKRHWESSLWWTQFLQTAEGEKIGLSFVRPGLENVRDWMMNQNSGAFYLLKELFGDKFIKTLEDQGEEKFSENKRYQKLMREFKAREQGNIKDLHKLLFFKDYEKEKIG